MTLTARRLAAVLLTVSGATHILQLAAYPAEGHVIGAAAFGVAYGVIGVFLFGSARGALWWGALLPALGGSLGVYRFLFLHGNPFSVFHVLVDLVVVPVCVSLLIRRPEAAV